MKYGKYLEQKARPEWRQHYLDYKGLKDLIKESVAEAESGVVSYSPRQTSLTVVKGGLGLLSCWFLLVACATLAPPQVARSKRPLPRSASSLHLRRRCGGLDCV